MKKKPKKKTSPAPHEYVIFIGGGILAVAVAIIAGYYSAGSDVVEHVGYRIRIHTDTFVYDALIHDEPAGTAFRKILPLTSTAHGEGGIMSIPVTIDFSGKPGTPVIPELRDILYDPDRGLITIVGEETTVNPQSVKIGKIDDIDNLYWNEPVDLPVRIEVR